MREAKNLNQQVPTTKPNLIDQTYETISGIYDFAQAPNTYTVTIDTTGVPYSAQCVYPGTDSVLVLNGLDTNINFSIACKPGFDIGVQSVNTNGFIFPGQIYGLNFIAGDMSHWYNLNCATGISGQVQITVTGNVTYIGPAIGALTPSNILGNVYTYIITDFDSVNSATAFNMIFLTNTTAQAGDTICINVAVTPTIGDNNVANNNFNFCYQVVNSHDPNVKETYPVDVLPAYNNWFTYTIHFQNTGTAPATNIRLIDTLSTNLNVNTFQVINYSHNNTFHFKGNMLYFDFANINLPDSNSNSLGSQGFVQYRVKPTPNLPAGTQIKNTANIYFDFNPNVITNTTINHFLTTTGINQARSIDSQINIYPNPTNNNFTIETNATDKQTLQIFDVNGKVVLTQTINGKTNIDASNLAEGVYNLSLTNANGVVNKRLVIVR